MGDVEGLAEQAVHDWNHNLINIDTGWKRATCSQRVNNAFEIFSHVTIVTSEYDIVNSGQGGIGLSEAAKKGGTGTRPKTCSAVVLARLFELL